MHSNVCGNLVFLYFNLIGVNFRGSYFRAMGAFCTRLLNEIQMLF